MNAMKKSKTTVLRYVLSVVLVLFGISAAQATDSQISVSWDQSMNLVNAPEISQFATTTLQSNGVSHDGAMNAIASGNAALLSSTFINILSGGGYDMDMLATSMAANTDEGVLDVQNAANLMTPNGVINQFTTSLLSGKAEANVGNYAVVLPGNVINTASIQAAANGGVVNIVNDFAVTTSTVSATGNTTVNIAGIGTFSSN